jgi:hypothetical protein
VNYERSQAAGATSVQNLLTPSFATSDNGESVANQLIKCRRAEREPCATLPRAMLLNGMCENGWRWAI